MPTKKRTVSPKPKQNKPTRSATIAATTAATLASATRVSASQKKRAEALLDLIARRKDRITEDFFEIGKALKELRDKKLHLALGYKSFVAMLEDRKLIGRTQANKLIEIVSRVPLATALKLGPEKAFALVRYTDATEALDTPEGLVEEGATLGTKPAIEASKRDIEQATKKLRRASKAKGKKPDAAAVEANRLAKRAAAWLRENGAKKAHAEALKRKDGHFVTITLSVADVTALLAH